ncbi:unnamed protein product [Rotaria socialis]|uniref:Peptidyl-prolyl cis-trans isomerase n=1 Tax=Rotaria socialis TaxID=392032 RepID=A0A817W536_9BILA|nr:unnamed protein product [Rotaria socialis]
MISDYVNNGQVINRNEFDKELSRKMREVLPPMLMRHDLLLSSNDGSGGERNYGKTLADENFNNKHSKPGTLSMTNFGSNTNNSQFFITYIELPFFDDTYIVLGEISSGMDVVHAIMNQGSVTGRPKHRRRNNFDLG